MANNILETLKDGTQETQIVDSATGAKVLSSAPGSDTGQPALAVRVISQLGAGAASSSTAINDGTTASQKAAVSAGGALKVDNSAVTQPVSGTFWQSTQPVSLATAPTTPVTGTFWQVTQPVSIATAPALVASSAVIGHVIVDTAPTTAVTGTFWQETQPVSIATMPSTPVTGTFWQSTQPISATSLPLPTGAALDASVLSFQGTVAAGTAATKASLGAGQFNTSLPTLTTGQQAAIQVDVNGRQIIAPLTSTSNVTVTPPTLTKGTQGATGFSVQNLYDSGRNMTNYFMAAQIVSTATDTLMSLTGYKGGAAVAATTTPAVVTAAKTYRITSATIEYVTIVTTPGAVRFTLRAQSAGVVLITSPAVTSWEVGEPTGVAPVAGKFNTVHLIFPEGLEFAAGFGIGVSMVGIGATGAAAVVGYGKISIHGYEY